MQQPATMDRGVFVNTAAKDLPTASSRKIAQPQFKPAGVKPQDVEPLRVVFEKWARDHLVGSTTDEGEYLQSIAFATVCCCPSSCYFVFLLMPAAVTVAEVASSGCKILKLCYETIAHIHS
jgi:hypothetical protein